LKVKQDFADLTERFLNYAHHYELLLLSCLCLLFYVIRGCWLHAVRFVVAMGYYGLSLNSGTLPGSLYLNFMLSGAIEFVADTACLPLNKLGRKGLHVFGMLVGGLACLSTIVIDLTMKSGMYYSARSMQPK
jgi:hypothetical protein